MILSLDDIVSFSTCPRFFTLDQGKKKQSLDLRIFTLIRAIQKSYIHQMKGEKPQWRKLMGWVDVEIFKTIDLTNEEQVQKGRDISESVLLPLKKWYDEVFLKEECRGYANLPLEVTKDGHLITHTIPILKLTDPMTVCIIDTIAYTQFQLYNNFLARGLGWLIARRFKVEEVIVEHYWIGPNRAIETTSIRCDIRKNLATGKAIKQIADSIAIGIDYPSRTVACNQCKYRQECIL